MRLRFAPAALAVCGVLAIGSAAASSNFGSAYLGLRGSYVFTDDGSTLGNAGADYDEAYEGGYATAVYLGWTVSENIRFEVEGGYSSADIDSITVVNNTLNYLAGDVVDVGSDVQVATAMGNFFYDFDLDGLRPYIGAGLGGARVEYNLTEPFGDFAGNDETWVFAYQLMAGLSFPLSDGLSMSVGYRYFKTEDFDRKGDSGELFKTDLTQHSVDVGVQFHL
jgi:opacity protein-like surface antigen